MVISRWSRWITIAAVLLLALIAAVVPYSCRATVLIQERQGVGEDATS